MRGKKRIQRIFTSVFIILFIISVGGKNSSAVELIENSTQKIRKTTITWDSSFYDYNYTLGSTIEFNVVWTVDKGTATYNGFLLDSLGPSDKIDSVMGEFVSDPTNISGNQGGEVKVEFKFTDLYLDEELNVEKGIAHFQLILNVDKNGDGTPDSVVNFGVNLEVKRGENVLPIANAGPDQTHTLAAGQTQIDITLDGSGSSDGDGTISSYVWTGVGGSPDPAETVSPTVTLSAGTYTLYYAT